MKKPSGTRSSSSRPRARRLSLTGEQRKYHNFATYCVEGLPNTTPDGFKLPFADGHARRLPRLTGGSFRFLMYGYDFLDRAMKYAHVPVKQAVISPSALSLMYPAENLPEHSREEFIEDLLREHEKERGCGLRRTAP
jgi:5-methyltetrahydropteroyltriglutamate--homocysteine methyltransferase